MNNVLHFVVPPSAKKSPNKNGNADTYDSIEIQQTVNKIDYNID